MLVTAKFYIVLRFHLSHLFMTADMVLTDSKDSFILINYLSIESPLLPLTRLNSIFEYISYPLTRKSFLKSAPRIKTPPRAKVSEIFLLRTATEDNLLTQILFLLTRL